MGFRRNSLSRASRSSLFSNCTIATSSVSKSLQFEPLERRDLLTTMLVNFANPSGGFNTATAADFAVTDSAVDLAAPVHVVGSGGATGLAGTNGSVFDVVDGGGGEFSTNKGVYENDPILDSYLFVNNVSRTVTVSSLEEIAGGQTINLTLYGVGDNNNQETVFTVTYDGATVGTGQTEYNAGVEDTYISLSFDKIVGVDQFEVTFQNAGTGSATGAINGFSITTPTAVRINAGGNSHVDSEGNQFLADQFFSTPSDTFAVTDDIFIPGTGGTTANDEDVDDILYQTERFAENLSYEIPVTNGFYTLRLHYAEIFNDDVNERIFDVTAEGDLISDDLDIFEVRQNAFTPGNFSALIQEFNLIEVTDGTMSLNFEAEGMDGLDNAKISAIEVLPVETPQLAIFQTGGSTEVLENGFTDTYSVSLTVAPANDVTVTINPGTEVTADVTELTFTPANFDQPQTITLTAVNDSDQDGTQTVSITHSLASLDPLYDGIASPSLSVSVFDDDLVAVDFDMRTLASGISNPTTGAFGPDGRLYVANGSGQIRAYTLDDDYNVTDTQIIDTIANQPSVKSILGIAFNPFEAVAPGESPTIYVTRSSLFEATTVYGSRVSTLTGADFSTVTDIVTGLAISGFDHGVNGIEFDGNGDLLINIGGNTNTGVFDGVFGSDAPESPLTSAVLHARITEPTFNGDIQYEFIDPSDPGIVVPGQPNNQLNGEFVKVVDVPGEIEVETFAVGLRNSFDLVYTTEGHVFVTDNGPNGIAQDELNYVPAGAFLGHPSIPRGKLDPRQTLANAEYNVNVPSDADYTAPLTALASSTNGIDQYRAETFGGQLNGQLFAQKWNGLVYFFERTADGIGLLNTNTRTDVADGLDILAGPAGSIIGIDRNENRVTIAEPVDPTVVDAKAYDIFPWRAPAVGGNQFVIGGANFGNLADTTVTIGGQEATLTSVADGKIVGILPAVPGVTLRDVVVTSAGTTSTLTESFLPLNGSPIVDSGDFDGDNDVDGSDFLAWQRGFGLTSGAAPGDGDANGDGAVDAADLTVWDDQYLTGGTLLAGSFASASAAPVAEEPTVDSTDLVDAAIAIEWPGEVADEEESDSLGEEFDETVLASVIVKTEALSAVQDDAAVLAAETEVADDDQSESFWLDDELLDRVFG